MINLPDQRIIDFIGEHHILTMAVSHQNIPYCATCYYAYIVSENRFVITSDHETRHIQDILKGNNFRIAGAIALETRIVGKIRGIQFTGLITQPDEEATRKMKAVYLKRFPVARLMPALHLWALDPEYIKMTDNRMGFGKKLIWKAESPETQAG